MTNGAAEEKKRARGRPPEKREKMNTKIHLRYSIKTTSDAEGTIIGFTLPGNYPRRRSPSQKSYALSLGRGIRYAAATIQKRGKRTLIDR